MKIILLANTDWYLYNFRLPLAVALRDCGHEVLLLSPPGRYVDLLKKAGFGWRSMPIERKGTNPLVELSAIVRLARIYRETRPQVVHHFTIKPVLYGSIAARLAGVHHVLNAITGLGHVFTDGKTATRVVRTIVKILYRTSLGGTIVIFQNTDDRELFLDQDLLKVDQTHLIAGSGVNLKRFAPTPEPAGTPVIILPGRLLVTKGVEDFVSAARQINRDGSKARFVLVGDVDPENPSSITMPVLDTWQKEGIIEWWGWHDDMDQIYARSNVVCLPSFYGEGLSRTLLEAAASGRACMATDIPGCRGIVRNNENGFLVQARDVQAIVKALTTLIEQPGMRYQMGIRGRQIVEQNYSEQLIVEQTLRLYP